MRFLLGLIFLAVFMLPAGAQNLPTAKEIGGIVFKEVEKRAIEEFFGKKAQKAAEDDDDDKKGKRGKKKKKKKAKKSKGQGRGQGLPPGLAKRDELPPGLQKRLEKRGPLPPGLAKRDLPGDLEKKLPKVPEGLERVLAGDNVVLLEKATGKILAVIEGVLRGKK